MLGAPDLPSALGPRDRGHCRLRLLRAAHGFDPVVSSPPLTITPRMKPTPGASYLCSDTPGSSRLVSWVKQDVLVARTRAETHIVDAEPLRLILKPRQPRATRSIASTEAPGAPCK